MNEEKTQIADGVASVLNAELDTIDKIVSRRIDEIMNHRFVAISVAAIQDTEEARKERITQDNIYWSPAYADMCRKVDELINARIEIERLRQTIKNEAQYCFHWRDESLKIGDTDRAKRHDERGNRLLAGI